MIGTRFLPEDVIMSKTKDGAASGRTHWLDEKTETPLIDEYVKKLGSFLEAMADGKIDASELKRKKIGSPR